MRTRRSWPSLPGARSGGAGGPALLSSESAASLSVQVAGSAAFQKLHSFLLRSLVAPRPPGLAHELRAALRSFCAAHAAVARHAHAECSLECDDVRLPVALLSDASVLADRELLLLALRALKVLARRPRNRPRIASLGARQLVHVLRLATHEADLRTECCKVVINLAFDALAARDLADAGCVAALLSLFGDACVAVETRGAAAGALQALCCHEDPRAAFVALGGTEAAVAALELDALRPRALAVLHNCTAHPAALARARRAGAVPLVVDLLCAAAPDVQAAAAGTLQNLAREGASLRLIRAQPAAKRLLALLFAGNVACQAAAVGALLNVLDCEEGDARAQLKAALADAVVLGVVSSLLQRGSAGAEGDADDSEAS
jgi:hypothetical protein